MAKDVELFWFVLVVIAVLVAIGGLPMWPYTRPLWPYRNRSAWSYAPSFAAAALFIFVMLLFWFGVIAIWWPWAAGM